MRTHNQKTAGDFARPTDVDGRTRAVRTRVALMVSPLKTVLRPRPCLSERPLSTGDADACASTVYTTSGGDVDWAQISPERRGVVLQPKIGPHFQGPSSVGSNTEYPWTTSPTAPGVGPAPQSRGAGPSSGSRAGGPLPSPADRSVDSSRRPSACGRAPVA